MFDKLKPEWAELLKQVRDRTLPPVGRDNSTLESKRTYMRKKGYMTFDSTTRRWVLTPLGDATLTEHLHGQTHVPVPGMKVCIDYTNYRGERGVREIIPAKLYFGKTEYHPEPQWLIDAWDVEKRAERTFAWLDVHAVYKPKEE